MAQQIINVGASPNDGQGNPIRTSFIKCNDNFNELYSRAQVTPPATLVGSIGDQAGMYAYDSTYFYYCFENYDGSSIIWAQVTQVGNITLAGVRNGSSNVEILTPNADITMGVAGTSNIVVVGNTLMTIDVETSVTGNITGGNILTVGLISATGNVTGNFILGNGSLLSGLPETYANANVAAYLPTYTGNISAALVSATGNLYGSNVVASANITGGNIRTTGLITATGNITGGNLVTSGRVSATGNVVTLGAVSAVGNITTDGYFIGNFQGNITGNLIVPGANTEILFNLNGNAGASSNFTFDQSTAALGLNGTAVIASNVTVGNLRTPGSITATGNVYSGNIIGTGIVSAIGNAAFGNITTGILSATGNLDASNVTTAGRVLATGNVTGGNLTTGGQMIALGNAVAANVSTSGFVTAFGNVTGANIFTAGVVSATGNISGNYFIGNGALLSGIDATSIQYGTSNVRVVSSGGNVSIGVGGTANIALYTTSGEFITGVISASGNVRGGNINTAGEVTATGNVTGGNITTSGRATVTGAMSAGGNVTGGNIITAGVVTATGNIDAANLRTSGVLTATGNVDAGNIRTSGLISASGAITGTAITGTAITGTSLTVSTGNITGGNIVNGNGNGVGNIGAVGGYFNTVFAKATSAQYADLAENYLADADYAPGTVVAFGGTQELTICSTDLDPTVAGVVSTNPAYHMNTGLEGAHVVALALQGRVPCKVVGPVRKGSMMVSAGNGQARAEQHPEIGTVIGKALESFDGEIGTIEIVVGRL